MADSERPRGARRPWLDQLLRFACVGVISYAVDAGTLTAVLSVAPAAFYLGRLLSYLTAASVGWLLNRHLTFQRGDGSPWRQWARFLLGNLSGGIVNYAVYAALIEFVPLCRSYPPVAIAAGSIAGLGLNFTVSRRFVFHSAQR
jgi:putative flippase GtrA